MTINREAAELMALRLTNAVDAAHTFAEALRLATVALQEAREVPEVEPGTVGTATVSGKRGVRVMRVQPDDRADRVYVWISDHTVGGMFAHADEDVTDFQADTTAEEWQKRLDSSVTYVADKWKAEIVRLEQERAAVDVDDLIAQAREAYDAAASHAPITVGLAAAVRRVLALVAADEQAAEGEGPAALPTREQIAHAIKAEADRRDTVAGGAWITLAGAEYLADAVLALLTGGASNYQP